MRVLGRSLKRIAAECKCGRGRMVDHGRAVKHRLLEISRANKSLTPAGQQRLRGSYHQLVGLRRGVVRQAGTGLRRWDTGRLKVVGDLLQVQTQASQLRHFLPWIEKVIAQTQERVWKGKAKVLGRPAGACRSNGLGCRSSAGSSERSAGGLAVKPLSAP